jgi:nicotinate-nucleotide adenylyltransferase
MAEPAFPQGLVGLMGGTFDPIHHAHLIVAEEVYATLKLSGVVFIPAGQPPHKVGHVHTSTAHRLRMVELAIASNAHFSLSRVEIDRAGPSYLTDTLHQLKEEWGPDARLCFIIGWDSLEDFPTWYDPTGILESLTYLVAVRRPGYVDDEEYNRKLETRLPGLMEKLRVVPVPQLDISSTDLRRRIAEHHPIKYQVPAEVEDYIVRNHLYQTGLGEMQPEKIEHGKPTN